MSLVENIVGCNLELPHQHTLEGDKLYRLLSPTMAARLMFYTFADEPLSGCHKKNISPSRRLERGHSQCSEQGTGVQQ